ncbi:C2H2-like zinc finger protein [Hirschfeldia incana]|nr:C2H2-like zinc finger protein [Hirschfeldia incana]
MEQFKERKFVCKFCSRRFACGKSLGGHIRTHMSKDNSADSDEDEHSKLRIDENGGQASYGLRENPKKNKKFVVQRDVMMAQQHRHQPQLLYCRECGKGFASSKALCGHMACHSEREKAVMDSQSDTEASSSPIRRRSKRAVKHHHHNHKADDAFVDGGGSIMDQSDSVASSVASEIEPEQEEAALSLMMLSRDSSFKKEHNLVFVNSRAESSDNNSVILETKSSSGEQLKILNVKNVEEFCKKDKLGGVDNGDVLYDSDNSDSGYFRNGPKKLDSDVSVDGFLKNTGFNNKTAMGFFNSYTTKQEKSLNRFRKEWSGSGSGSGRSSTKYDLRKSKRGFPCYGRKKIKYELTESVYDSDDQHSLETESCADTNRSIKKIHSNKSTMVKKASSAKKKSKGHECPICFRVFKSGQALGGHKRSHFIGSQDHRTLVIQQHHQVAHEMHTLIDLNLPAPIDE